MLRKWKRIAWTDVFGPAVVIGLLTAFVWAFVGPHGDGTRATARRAKCMANLKGISQNFSIYAAVSGDHYPASSAKVSSLCQQGPEVRNAFGGFAGVPDGLKMFYCPANDAQDPTKLWGPASGVSTWGYACLNDRGAGMAATLPARVPALEYISIGYKIAKPSAAVLALDVIVTDTDAGLFNYNASGIAVPFGSNVHPLGTRTSVPAYVNVGFMDGHVANLKYDQKTAAPMKQPGGGFFWFPNP